MATAKIKPQTSVIKNGLKCLLLTPLRAEVEEVRRALEAGSKEAGAQLVYLEDSSLMAFTVAESLSTQLTNVDLVVALASANSTSVFYEAGLVHAFGKPVVFLLDNKEVYQSLPTRGSVMIAYTNSPKGLTRLQTEFRELLTDFRRSPSRFRMPSKSLPSAFPIIDLERVDPREFENLCFELLTQMGFRRVEWGKELKEIDVVASLPKKDPDGFEYDELWLISMGRNFPPEFFFELVAALTFSCIAFFDRSFWRGLGSPLSQTHR